MKIKTGTVFLPIILIFIMTIVEDLVEFLPKDEQHPSHHVLMFLVHLLYIDVRLTGAIHNDIKYSELPNDWSWNNDALTDEDKSKKCDGYGECNSLNVPRDVGAKVTFTFDYSNLKEKSMIGTIENYFPEFDIPGVYDYLAKLDEMDDQPFFKGTIKIRNPCGINEDHRGSDHCEIVLPFRDEVTLTNPTLNEFINGLYSLKSHKFDKNYEMFINCRFYKPEEGDDISIVTDFDHGS